MIESSPLVDSVTVNSQSESTSNKSTGTFTDYLANERTFLAWTRTGLGIFAFGCAIARFGGSKDSFHEMKPMISGLILIACGIITLFYSIYRYYRINQQIIRNDLTNVSQIRQPIFVTLVLLLSMIAILIIFVIL